MVSPLSPLRKTESFPTHPPQPEPINSEELFFSISITYFKSSLQSLSVYSLCVGGFVTEAFYLFHSQLGVCSCQYYCNRSFPAFYSQQQHGPLTSAWAPVEVSPTDINPHPQHRPETPSGPFLAALTADVNMIYWSRSDHIHPHGLWW